MQDIHYTNSKKCRINFYYNGRFPNPEVAGNRLLNRARTQNYCEYLRI